MMITRRTTDTDTEIKDLIRITYLGDDSSTYLVYYYHIKIGVSGLNRIEITIILEPELC